MNAHQRNAVVLATLTERFLASGGNITQCKQGEHSAFYLENIQAKDQAVATCQCGCQGDYYTHTSNFGSDSLDL